MSTGERERYGPPSYLTSVLLLSLIACSALFEPAFVPENREVVRQSLTGNFRDGALDLERLGTPKRAINASVQTVRFSLRPGFEVRGALWTPDLPSDVGVVVAHGHYGQGKSGAESQEIAHRLAARGAWVLAVDTPGVEEWDVDDRRIHFDEGAHNRGILYARGSSALTLQLDVLRRGVDVLVDQGASRIGATGASGGAVQAFYLGWTDERVSTAVMASPPPIPREAAASGCACDHIPGWPGPDPHVLAQWAAPTLWLSDVEQARPAGLPGAAVFDVLVGPHSYTDPMQRKALGWFEKHLGLRSGGWVESVPSLDLSEPIDRARQVGVAALEGPGMAPWIPLPKGGLNPRWTCSGEGPRVVTLGPVEDGLLETAGYERCALDLPTDMSAWIEGVGTGKPLADHVLGGIAAGVRQKSPVAIVASRGWGLVAGGHGVPFVVVDPLTDLSALRGTDPHWVHVPGAWDGVARSRIEDAAATGETLAEVLPALQR